MDSSSQLKISASLPVSDKSSTSICFYKELRDEIPEI